MVTGALKSQIDAIWDASWSGGISNPIEVIEQLTYLLFLKRLDELQDREDSKAARVKGAAVARVFPKGKDKKGRPFKDYRWSEFKHRESKEMFTIVSEHVFPWLRTLGGDGSAYTKHMEGARFTIPTPGLLAKVVDLLDQVPMEDRDTKGDVYEYMLGKIAGAGQNGQFRTPRHIIRLMVELTEVYASFSSACPRRTRSASTSVQRASYSLPSLSAIPPFSIFAPSRRVSVEFDVKGGPPARRAWRLFLWRIEA